MRGAILAAALALAGSASAACTPAPATRLLVEQTARMHGLPPLILTALVMRESGFCANAVSRTGAIGYGQLMPATARDLGVDPYDPRQNVWGSAKYLRQQWDTFEDWRLALAAYNAGPGAVTRYGGIPPYQETQAYVRNVLGTYNVLSGRGRVLQPALASASAQSSAKPTAAPPAPLQTLVRPPAGPQGRAPSTAVLRPSSPQSRERGVAAPAKPVTPVIAQVSQAPQAVPAHLLIVRTSAPLTSPTAHDSGWAEQTSASANSMLVYRASRAPMPAMPVPSASPDVVAQTRP